MDVRRGHETPCASRVHGGHEGDETMFMPRTGLQKPFELVSSLQSDKPYQDK
jgi:hypothetical protein